MYKLININGNKEANYSFIYFPYLCFLLNFWLKGLSIEVVVVREELWGGVDHKQGECCSGRESRSWQFCHQCPSGCWKHVWWSVSCSMKLVLKKETWKAMRWYSCLINDKLTYSKQDEQFSVVIFTSAWQKAQWMQIHYLTFLHLIKLTSNIFTGIWCDGATGSNIILRKMTHCFQSCFF